MLTSSNCFHAACPSQHKQGESHTGCNPSFFHRRTVKGWTMLPVMAALQLQSLFSPARFQTFNCQNYSLFTMMPVIVPLAQVLTAAADGIVDNVFIQFGCQLLLLYYFFLLCCILLAYVYTSLTCCVACNSLVMLS